MWPMRKMFEPQACGSIGWPCVRKLRGHLHKRPPKRSTYSFYQREEVLDSHTSGSIHNNFSRRVRGTSTLH
jgi:hypothetical protein